MEHRLCEHGDLATSFTVTSLVPGTAPEALLGEGGGGRGGGGSICCSA